MRVTTLLTTAAVWLAACTPPPVTTKPEPPGDDTSSGDSDDPDTDDSHAGDTQDSHSSVDTNDTGMLDYDCDNLPEGMVDETPLPWARGYHDVVFDLDGHLIGMDATGNLMKADYEGNLDLWIPGIQSSEGMDRLPDGRIVYAGWSAGVTAVSPDGTQEVLVPNAGDVHGVTVGPDHKVYYANTGIYRVDPATHEIEELIPRNPQQGYRHLIFNLDSTRMYIATLARGDIWYVDLDEDLNPTGPVEHFAEDVGGGWHDGIGIDACGNLYVAEYYTMALYRVRADASVEVLGRLNSGSDYGHGLEWGSGLGGWKTGALYLPLPYDQMKVKEVWIGAPSGHLVRTWNGEVVEPW